VQRFILTLSCPDRKGIVAAVANFLLAQDCNIVDSAQSSDEQEGLFFMRVSFATGQTGMAPDLRGGFSAVAEEFAMQWAIHDGAHRGRVLIMVSKLDHCLEDLLYRQRTGELNMEISATVSNHPDMEPVARRHGIAYHLMPVSADNKRAQEARLLELIASSRSELVVLARYMQIFSDEMCKRLHGRAINIHHSFLPGFKGAKPYHQAHARGVKLIGATAHFVTGDLDEGPIIEQVVERVDHSFTPEMLAATGRDSERRALSTAVRLFLEHRVFLDEHKTVVFK